jgi:hypothetical protein
MKRKKVECALSETQFSSLPMKDHTCHSMASFLPIILDQDLGTYCCTRLLRKTMHPGEKSQGYSEPDLGYPSTPENTPRHRRGQALARRGSGRRPTHTLSRVGPFPHGGVRWQVTWLRDQWLGNEMQMGAWACRV